MTNEPLVSSAVFDYLRQQGVEPYTKLNDSARDQLGDGVRLIALFAGDVFSTCKSGLRISVLSGQISLEPASSLLDLETTRERTVLTQEGDNRFVARADAVMVLADAEFLDTLSSWTELAAYASQTESAELAARLLSIRHAIAFSRLPLEHVLQALRLMQPRPVKAGEVIVTQGERGDAFYLIVAGRAEIWKADIYDDAPQLVATLGPEETFGDEALVIGGNRNATVKMIEDGELLVLGEQDFRKLMSQPLLEEIAPEAVMPMLGNDWTAIDVRYAEEFEDGHIQDAIHLPLPELRANADAMLNKSGKYITVCLSGKRSSVAAFLLKQRGYRVMSMKGGMSDWPGEVVC